ncbi:hypothetical protein BLNAU_11064 [Blattamonas nauphoetae]|uniref:Uncharacterized protein n=1 Tax=Blattamonas nauphoetae TaxID=2049346 RepID=A0ABQ9XNH4_9EUKA|nr:hypothetical protein BLNAU_11064 [Blattamonas nauphoetae]
MTTPRPVPKDIIPACISMSKYLLYLQSRKKPVAKTPPPKPKALAPPRPRNPHYVRGPSEFAEMLTKISSLEATILILDPVLMSFANKHTMHSMVLVAVHAPELYSEHLTRLCSKDPEGSEPDTTTGPQAKPKLNKPVGSYFFGFKGKVRIASDPNATVFQTNSLVTLSSTMRQGSLGNYGKPITMAFGSAPSMISLHRSDEERKDSIVTDWFLIDASDRSPEMNSHWLGLFTSPRYLLATRSSEALKQFLSSGNHTSFGGVGTEDAWGMHRTVHVAIVGGHSEINQIVRRTRIIIPFDGSPTWHHQYCGQTQFVTRNRQAKENGTT